MMFSHYLKISLRNILRQRFYSFINVFGLALGIAVSLVISIYIVKELSYDRFHKKADRICRIGTTYKFSGEEGIDAMTSMPLAQRLMESFPQVEAAVRVFPPFKGMVKYKSKAFSENRIYAVDPNFFKVFDFKIIDGNLSNTLAQKNSILLTKSTAKKYFGEERPIGKIIELVNGGYFKVTGIVEDLPVESHFHFDMLTSSLNISELRDWGGLSNYTYVLLKNNISPESLGGKLPELVRKYTDESGMVGDYDSFLEAGNKFGHTLIPLTAIHLHSKADSELESNGSITDVYSFTAIALFIIALASINFINLATARSAVRAKEVGVRKVLGSIKKQLVLQFLTESVLLTFLSMVLGLCLAELIVLTLNHYFRTDFLPHLLAYPFLLPWAALVFLVLGVITGIYPAFYLTAFKPIHVLKGNLRVGMKSGVTRNLLVVLQFSISVSLIICTFVIFKQLNFILDKEMGFERENVILIDNSNERLGNNLNAYKKYLMSSSSISSVSVALQPPSSIQWDYTFFPEGTTEGRPFNINFVDEAFVPTMKLQLKAGRNFSSSRPADADGVLINETAAEKMGLKNPLGATITSTFSGQARSYKILGILKDFNFQSLHSTITPVALLYLQQQNNLNSTLVVKINPGDLQNTLKKMEKEWKKLAPSAVFEYSFLDEQIEKMYKAEFQLGSIISVFTAFAIFIACLGLFGLASFATEQRTKEIGIRKVLGASVFQITSLLSRDFIRLVIFANLISWPFAYFLSTQWLQNFAYRISLIESSWIFVTAGILAALIALLTIGIKAIRAALGNPVNSLRSE